MKLLTPDPNSGGKGLEVGDIVVQVGMVQQYEPKPHKQSCT